MADMLLCDHLEELWMLIHQQHLLYLISDESPRKLDQREKLESYIKEYLCLAPHSRKFTFPQTAQVLHRSAGNKNFSGYKAALAWKAIGKYADNLVVQPWRKEFKDLKLYCGFYKHEVAENLTDAELMFEAMGYCHAGNSTMAITDILDPDRITSVSKDAIVAYVECQILKQIWDNLSSYYNFTWLEILEFRENHTGTPDQAIRSLRYKRRQRQYEEQMYRRAQYQGVENHSRPDYAYGSNMGYLNHVYYPGHSYSYPVHSRFSMPHIVSPTNMYPPPVHPAVYGPQQAIKPQDLYPPNGYHMHAHYQPTQPLQDAYAAHPPGYHAVHPQQSSVPTAQLIELDAAPAHSSEPYGERSQGGYPEDDVTSKWQELDKSESNFPSGKAKEDGAGSWENWDYVYRNLESQGYKKNLSSRGEAVNAKTNSSSRSNAAESADAKAQGELIDKIKKMSVGKGEGSAGESEESVKSKAAKRTTSTLEVVREQVPEGGKGGASPEKGKRVCSPGHKGGGNGQRRGSDSETESSRGRKSSGGSGKAAPAAAAEEEEAADKWQCVSCTYLNSSEKPICEMCCKSKNRGDERPQPSGGQECRNCTLVNERGRNFCVACDQPLKDSATYI